MLHDVFCTHLGINLFESSLLNVTKISSFVQEIGPLDGPLDDGDFGGDAFDFEGETLDFDDADQLIIMEPQNEQEAATQLGKLNIQRGTKWYANLAKQDPGKARKSS